MRSSLLGRGDDAELAAFCCCGEGAAPWQLEVEEYIRSCALRQADRILGLRQDDGQLVGVSAFDPRTIGGLPIQRPIRTRGWYLRAIAIALKDQGDGYSTELLKETLATMLKVDPSRSLVTATIHADNKRSIRACAKVGIEVYLPAQEDGYHQLIGPIPGTTPPEWFE